VSDQPPYVPLGPLTSMPGPPAPEPAEEPPADAAGRETSWVADHTRSTRDTTPAVGSPASPGPWRRAVEGASVALTRRGWADAAWSFLYKHDTSYAADPVPGQVAAANRRMRNAPMPTTVHGPFMKAPVWTWEVPLYFWVGGVATGSSFVALACDLAGDERSARIARRVALGAVMPAPVLLIADLGRPGRFVNMLRIFKPRSPMNMGAWCLVVFSASAAASVGADLVRLRRPASALGAVTAFFGGYLGSYTGVLLASTAVPLWARSRLFLGPIFVATATATGASACRLTLVAAGLPEGHPTRSALGTLEAGAMLTELTLSTVNERRLGRASAPLSQGRAGRLFKFAKWAVRGGLVLGYARSPLSARYHHVASVLYLAAGLAFRFAWVEAGKESAHDEEAVALTARGRVTVRDDLVDHGGVGPRKTSLSRRPVGGGFGPGRVWTEAVRRFSLAVDGVLHSSRG